MIITKTNFYGMLSASCWLLGEDKPFYYYYFFLI